MKHLRKFENFNMSEVDSDEQDFLDYSKKIRDGETSNDFEDDMEDDFEDSDIRGDFEDDMRNDFDEDTFGNNDMRNSFDEDTFGTEDDEDFRDTSIMLDDPLENEERFNSKLERARWARRFEAKKNLKKDKPKGKESEKGKDKEVAAKKGLSAAQKRLPKALQDAILKKQK